MTRLATAAAVTAATVCSLILASCTREPAPQVREREETIVPVGAVPAETAGIRAVVRSSGAVTPSEGAEFLAVAPEPATIVEIPGQEGDAVRTGDILVRFDLPAAAQDVARYSADLAAAEAQVENARLNQSRVRDFVERGLVPRRDLEAADREFADAQAAVERARAAQARAAANAGRAIVRAPFDGVIAARRRNPGDVVLSTTDPIVRVVDPRRLDVVAAVQDADASRVVPGATARIAGPLGSAPVGLKVLRRLASAIGPAGTIPFLLQFDQPTQLAVDTPVELDIDAEERTNTVLVPAEALIRDGAETVVMVADGARAVRRVVTTGIQDEARVEITNGLRAGELVITRGHIGLADGAAISVAAGR